MSTSLMDLPAEILLLIFTYLNISDLFSLMRASKHMREIAMDDCVWIRFTKQLKPMRRRIAYNKKADDTSYYDSVREQIRLTIKKAKCSVSIIEFIPGYHILPLPEFMDYEFDRKLCLDLVKVNIEFLLHVKPNILLYLELEATDELLQTLQIKKNKCIDIGEEFLHPTEIRLLVDKIINSSDLTLNNCRRIIGDENIWEDYVDFFHHVVQSGTSTIKVPQAFAGNLEFADLLMESKHGQGMLRDFLRGVQFPDDKKLHPRIVKYMLYEPDLVSKLPVDWYNTHLFDIFIEACQKVEYINSRLRDNRRFENYAIKNPKILEKCTGYQDFLKFSDFSEKFCLRLIQSNIENIMYINSFVLRGKPFHRFLANRENDMILMRYCEKNKYDTSFFKILIDSRKKPNIAPKFEDYMFLSMYRYHFGYESPIPELKELISEHMDIERLFMMRSLLEGQVGMIDIHKYFDDAVKSVDPVVFESLPEEKRYSELKINRYMYQTNPHSWWKRIPINYQNVIEGMKLVRENPKVYPNLFWSVRCNVTLSVVACQLSEENYEYVPEPVRNSTEFTKEIKNFRIRRVKRQRKKKHVVV